MAADYSFLQLSEILNKEQNRLCADCSCEKPTWASINIGVFMCIQCSGVHRSLGVHVSQVRSCDLDRWTPSQIAVMQVVGNKRANQYLEYHMLPFEKPQATDPFSVRDRFIRAKYVFKNFVPESHDEIPRTSLKWPSQSIERRGWAQKAGGGHKSKAFKRRFFVLRDYVLSYFKKQGDSYPAGTVTMIEVKTVSFVPEDQDPFKKFCLALVTPFRTYYIVYDSNNDLVDWLLSFRAAVYFAPFSVLHGSAPGHASGVERESSSSSSSSSSASLSSVPSASLSPQVNNRAAAAAAAAAVGGGGSSSSSSSDSNDNDGGSSNNGGQVIAMEDGEDDDEDAEEALGRQQNASVPLPELEKREREGYLTKQGGHRSSWKRRYFILSSSLLYYAKSPSDRCVLGVIDLADCTLDLVDASLTKRENSFSISVHGRVYYLAADSRDLQKAWMDHIRRNASAQAARRSLALFSSPVDQLMMENSAAVSPAPASPPSAAADGSGASASASLDAAPIQAQGAMRADGGGSSGATAGDFSDIDEDDIPKTPLSPDSHPQSGSSTNPQLEAASILSWLREHKQQIQSKVAVGDNSMSLPSRTRTTMMSKASFEYMHQKVGDHVLSLVQILPSSRQQANLLHYQQQQQQAAGTANPLVVDCGISSGPFWALSED